ncbi:OsmC-like protein [Athelia psychrophila]|uniref:OsmC-like protein n=1 Tax=Athelia psychrophila TaxID=1759441 RepID=A0A166IHN6_9AGAM|nr:OsmC-like protein [Fibularhizoctonia sp. CBS 109695]
MLNITARSTLKNAARLRAISAQPTIAKRTIITLKDHKYTAHAKATGGGRNGEVSSDGPAGLNLHLSSPKALGGKEDGQNPEQLFAMGYSSCFLGALHMMAKKTGKEDLAKNAVIHARVHLGEAEKIGGFGIAVDISVEGVEDDALIQAAHENCPYSRALSQGAVVNVSKA